MRHPTLARSCCTTPSAMCFWAAMFLVFYGSGLLLQSASPALEPYVDTLILASMAAACVVNFARHRTLHCALTGPFFLVAAIVAALEEAGIWSVDIVVLWGVVLAGVGIAFFVEWRTFAGRRRTSSV